MKESFLLEAFQLPSESTESLRTFFTDLPADPYHESKCRFRAFSKYQNQNGQFVKLTDNTFTQSSDVNRLIGDVPREFAEISADLDQHAEFQDLLAMFARRTHTEGTDKPIGVHQIRVVCSPGQAGSGAPEGIHQDGFEYVGIFCVKRDNIAGGFTQVFTSPVEQHPHMSTTIEENQIIIINDRRYYHYVTETKPQDPSREGLRDVFVLTA